MANANYRVIHREDDSSAVRWQTTGDPQPCAGHALDGAQRAMLGGVAERSARIANALARTAGQQGPRCSPRNPWLVSYRARPLNKPDKSSAIIDDDFATESDKVKPIVARLKEPTQGRQDVRYLRPHLTLTQTSR
jgi:hypothetical protein